MKAKGLPRSTGRGESEAGGSPRRDSLPAIASGSAALERRDPFAPLILWASRMASGPSPTVILPLGTHCIELTVEDPSGHKDVDFIEVTVEDTTGPELTVQLSPATLWPPNHKLIDVDAIVEAFDLCGDVSDMQLVSITSNEADNGLGDGDTSGDIVGARGTGGIARSRRPPRCRLATACLQQGHFPMVQPGRTHPVVVTGTAYSAVSN